MRSNVVAPPDAACLLCPSAASCGSVFRDRLRTRAADRSLYEATKRKFAASDRSTMQHCADAKCQVVEAIIARAQRTDPQA